MASDNDQGTSATTTAAEASTNATVLMDRFVSASSTQDALDSLQKLVDEFKTNKHYDTNWLLKDSPNVVEDLIHVIVTQKTPRDLPFEDGVSLVCQLYLNGLADNPLSLQVPTPGRLLEAMIDVMEDPSRPVYTRVLALQVLKRVSVRHSSASQAQWLQAPNGMQRLADIIVPPPGEDTNRNPMEEEMVRNEALLVALELAKRHASIAKFWLGFVELETKLLDLCWTEGGGLTRGTPIVLDSLGLIVAMLRHADASMQDLVWQRPTVAPRLAQLLDLRGGTQFLHPEELAKATAAVATATASGAKDSSKDVKKSHTDDLDDLLQSGETKKASTGSQAPSSAEAEDEGPVVPIPRLTKSEEEVVQKVLQVLQLLLQSEPLRAAVWKQHAGLCSLVWELALVSPAVPPVCAMPSPSLQQQALEVVAGNFNDPTIMDRLGGGMDRVLFLVCTGGGAGTKSFSRTVQEQLGISQAALHVLRRTLSGETIQQLLLHTLAPPLDETDDSSSQPPGPTVIQKLWNTVADFLVPPTREENESDKSYISKRNQRKVFLSGALGGLGIFLHDDTCREMMFKVAPPHLANLDRLLEAFHEDNGNSDNDSALDTGVQWVLLRFFCEWVMDTPLMVHTLLSSNESTYLAAVAATGSRTGIASITTSMVHLLLGLAMEHMGDDHGAEEKCGGWTRAGILQIITKIGIGKYTSSLERFKKLSKEEAIEYQLPWATSDLEFKHFKEWYGKAVWVVRKRVVEELTGGSGGDDNGDDDDDDIDGQTSKRPAESADKANALSQTPGRGETTSAAAVASPTSSSGSGLKPLQRLIAQQTREIEDLREDLAKSEAKVQSQQKQLDNWNRRVESTPTELDTMLNEFTAKNGQLEEQIAALQKELNDAKSQHREELKHRDDKIRQYQEESRDLQGQVEEAREDRDRMEQELQALSQAYTSLEDEFQRQQQQDRQDGTQSTTDNTSERVAGGAETGEASEQSEQRQPQGEVSQQAPAYAALNATAGTGNTSTEVATLRSENNRLRNDARAADEWMSMAVQRMNEMAAHNGNLERQVATLSEQLSAAGTPNQQQQAGAVTTDSSSQAQNEQQMQARLQHEQQQLELLRQQLQVSTQQEQELRQRVEALSIQLHEEQDLRQRSADTLGESIGRELDQEREAKRELEAQLASSREDTRLAMESLGKAKDEREQLERQIATLNTELEKSRVSGGMNEEVGPGQYISEEIRVRDEEIAELHAANQAAQDWMSKAVEHHKVLTAQVALLSEEKASLELELKEGTEKHKGSDAGEASDKLLEVALDERTEELNRVKAEFQQCHEELQSLRQEMETHKAAQGELEIAREELSNLRQQLEDARISTNSAEQHPGDSSGSGGSSMEEMEALRKENDSLRSISEDLQNRLEEFQVWANTAQQRISEVLAAKEQVEKQLQQANEAVERITREKEELQATLEASPAKNSSQKGIQQNALDLTNELKVTNETLTKERNEKENELVDLQARYGELQDWVDAAQSRMVELFSAKESAESRLAEANVMIESRQQEIEIMQTSLDEYKAKDYQIDGMRGAESATISELQAQLKEKDDALLELQQNLSQDEQNSLQWEERVSELESALQEMKSQLEQKEQESHDVMEKWQVICNGHEERCVRLEEELEVAKKEKYALEEERRPIVDNQLEPMSPSDALSASEFFGGGETDGHHVNPQLIKQLESQLQEKEDALQQAREALVKDEDVVHEWEERVTELESTVQGLQSQLEQQELDAKSVIDQWQEACSTSDARCSELEQELENLKKDSIENAKVGGVEEAPSHELSPGVQTQSAHAFFSTGEPDSGNHRINALEEQLKETEAALREAREILSRDEDVVQQWEERVAELESTVKALESQLEEQEQETNVVIEKWQESCAAAEERCSNLEQELDALKAKDHPEGMEGTQNTDTPLNEGAEVTSQTALDFFGQPDRRDIAELEARLREKEAALQEAQESLARDEDVVSQWEDRVAELESKVKDLENQLEEQEREANNVIDQWQENCAVSDSKCSELEDELDAARKENEILRQSSGDHGVNTLNARSLEGEPEGSAQLAQRIEQLETQLQEKEQALLQLQDTLANDEDVVHQWEGRTAELEASVKDLQDQLQEQETEANLVISKWQESCAASEELCSQRENELSSVIDQNNVLSQKLADAEADGSMLEIEKASLEDQVSSLEKLLSASREAASALEQNHSEGSEELEGRLSEKDEILREAQQSMDASERIIQQLKDRILELESSVEEKERNADGALKRLTEDLATSEQQREQLEKELAEYSKAYGDVQEENQKLEDEKASLKEQVGSLESALREERQLGNDKSAQTDNEQLQNQIKEAEAALHRAQETLVKEKDNARQLEGLVAELKANIKEMEEHRQDDVDTVSQLQHRCSELESKNAELRQNLSQTEGGVAGQLDEVAAKLEAAENKLSQAEEIRLNLLKELSQTEATIATLREDLNNKENQIIHLETRLEEFRSSSSEDEVLNKELKECKAQLARITGEHAEQIKALRTEHEKLLIDLQEGRLALSEARDESSSLRQELEEVRNESEDIVNQWTERCSELETMMKELEEQLDKQMNEANEAISSWENRCTEYETQIDELETELNAATELLNQVDIQIPNGAESSLVASIELLLSERQAAIQARGALHAQMDAQSEKEENMEKQIERLKANLNYLMETSDRVETELEQERRSRSELQEEVGRLDDCYKEIVESEQKLREALESSQAHSEETDTQLQLTQRQLEEAREELESTGREQLEKERDRLTIVIAQLEEELREANEMVQVYVTDGASDKAAEVMAQALRSEIEDLRLQLTRDRESLLGEKIAREDAEQEVKRLSSDIAALISLSDHEFSLDESKMLSIKATEKLSKKERAEIEQLRKSLHRALDDLDHARAAEKEANERLSKIRLKASVCEQDIVAAKSELNFMAQTMEEMRATEESNRASLEYRIGSLENDNDVLRRYHAGEIESLRSDLEQATMEKDRILHALKECEKRNASLLLASEAEDESEYMDVESEVAMLRVKNAHLLTVAGDDKARAERRLRETLGAQASSAEADAILERELRIAAEASVQTMKIELEELRAKLPDEYLSLREMDKRAFSPSSVDSLKSELKTLKGEAENLRKDNADLKSKMEVASAKAKSDMAKLTEDCRRAQARVHKLEREGRFEAAVKSEVSRIHMSPGSSTFENGTGGDNEWLVVGQNSEAGGIIGTGAYDYILKQKESIQEERAMYIELLSEHDSLLALLAQRDEERASLLSALKDLAGQEGVDAAIREAERNSMTRYGNIVRTP